MHCSATMRFEPTGRHGGRNTGVLCRITRRRFRAGPGIMSPTTPAPGSWPPVPTQSFGTLGGRSSPRPSLRTDALEGTCTSRHAGRRPCRGRRLRPRCPMADNCPQPGFQRRPNAGWLSTAAYPVSVKPAVPPAAQRSLGSRDSLRRAAGRGSSKLCHGHPPQLRDSS